MPKQHVTLLRCGWELGGREREREGVPTRVIERELKVCVLYLPEQCENSDV